MKKISTQSFLYIFICLSLIFGSNAFAVKKGDWLFRFGVAHVSPNDKSTGLTGAPTVGVGADSDTQLFVNVTYMYSDNIGIELLAVTPFKHNVTGTGAVTTKVGETKQLPPTLSLQYHFTPSAKVKPYVGVGLTK